MKRIFLIRHAQASFGSDQYDRLSPLGHQQADRLGAFFKDSPIDGLQAGDLVRHRETVEGVLKHRPTPLHYTPNSLWNEFDHRAVFFAYRPDLNDQETREAWRAGLGDQYDAEVMATYRAALLAWMAGELHAPESWDGFVRRVRQAWAEAKAHPGRETWVITSAGPISVILGDLLGWNASEISHWQTHLWNSALCEIALEQGEASLIQKNVCPHLAHDDSLMTLK